MTKSSSAPSSTNVNLGCLPTAVTALVVAALAGLIAFAITSSAQTSALVAGVTGVVCFLLPTVLVLLVMACVVSVGLLAAWLWD